MPGGSTGDIASSYYPARGLYSSSSEPVVARPDARDRRGRRPGGGLVVVGLGLGRGRPAAADRQGGARRRARRRRPPRAVPGTDSIETVEADIDHLRTLGITRIFVYQPLRHPRADWADLRAREPGIQLYAQTTLVGRAAQAEFDGVYTYDVLLWGGDMFSRFCAQAHRVEPRVPAVGRSRLRRDARDRRPPGQAAPGRRHLRRDVARGDPLERRRRDDHELQRVARGHPDRAGSRSPSAAPRRPSRSRPTTAPTGARPRRRARRTSTARPTGRRRFLRSRRARARQLAA